MMRLTLTNYNLNKILPKRWKRMDEFTIVAPILNQLDYNKLCQRAEEFDVFDEIGKK